MGAVRTTCPYCGVGCGIAATPARGRALKVKGDAEHPANRGSLCSKGTHLPQTVGLEGRLLHPMIGDRRVSWDAALDEVAGRLRNTIAEHGPDSVAFYVSGQLLTEDYYVVNKLAKGFIGTANIDTNSRLCMASAVAAHQRAFGEDVVPCSYDDLDEAELIVMVGSNAAWCHPVVWQRIERARQQRGTKLVVIDPRKTETVERADLHIPVEPDGDVALFNAALCEMRLRGKLDEAFLEERCSVPPGFWEVLEETDPGIDGSLFGQFVDLLCGHERMVTLFSQGVNQSVAGTDKGSAIINLHLATGRINRPGMGPFSITGQPNAMGGREVGGLATMLAAHLGFSPAERAEVGRFWKAPRIANSPGLKAVELFHAVHSGRIKFLWIMATNPAVSMPDADFVREALGCCPTVVVSDVIADTDTARFAHIRLPAQAWGEKDGTVTNSERRVSRQRAFFEAPGEARADWEVLCGVAARLGHEDGFRFGGPAAVFREFAAMTELSVKHGKLLDLSAWSDCSDGEYREMLPFQWGGAHPCARRFPTPEGRAHLIATTPRASAPVSEEFPLRLNTGRYRDQWHTMTRTGLSARLSVHRREPLVEVHPDDAELHSLQDGGLARISTSQGNAIYRVAVTAAQQSGQIFVPMHWSDALSGAGRTGRLTSPATDPHSGQPGFKDTPAGIEPVTPEWRAFLLSREPAVPATLYWVRVRIASGWLTEIAGNGTIDYAALLPAGARSEATDMARGMRRIVVTDEAGAIGAALFITRSGTLPARDWLERKFASEEASVGELLAGRPAQSSPDRGPTVCVCHDIAEQQVLAAIAEGAESVGAIGERTCAGTNCGSCRPILSRMLDEARTAIQEAAQ